ncbi:MAG: hypothetical protein O7G85_04235 [Planctomycetota bacterium]|nr:hypothetical protein [Planctomycetota bacterium]
MNDRQAFRIRRLASFILGVLTQLGLGLLVWYFPPRTSVGSWILYFGLGFLGFVQIIWGARGAKQTSPLEMERQSVTSAFEPDDISYHNKVCQHCDENLASTIAKGKRRCPNCTKPFSLRDLGWRDADPRGEPVSYAPHESRMQGGVLVIIVLLVFVMISCAFWGMGLARPQTSPTHSNTTPNQSQTP